MFFGSRPAAPGAKSHKKVEWAIKRDAWRKSKKSEMGQESDALEGKKHDKVITKYFAALL